MLQSMGLQNRMQLSDGTARVCTKAMDVCVYVTGYICGCK